MIRRVIGACAGGAGGGGICPRSGRECTQARGIARRARRRTFSTNVRAECLERRCMDRREDGVWRRQGTRRLARLLTLACAVRTTRDLGEDSHVHVHQVAAAHPLGVDGRRLDKDVVRWEPDTDAPLTWGAPPTIRLVYGEVADGGRARRERLAAYRCVAANDYDLRMQSSKARVRSASTRYRGVQPRRRAFEHRHAYGVVVVPHHHRLIARLGRPGAACWTVVRLHGERDARHRRTSGARRAEA